MPPPDPMTIAVSVIEHDYPCPATYTEEVPWREEPVTLFCIRKRGHDGLHEDAIHGQWGAEPR